MLFVSLILGAQVTGACAALVLWPVVPPHLRCEAAVAIAAYTVTLSLMALAHRLLASQDEASAAAPPGAPAAPAATTGAAASDEGTASQRHQALFLAHGFCLRHLGLRHAVMLSVPQASRGTAPDLAQPAPPSPP